MAKPEIKLTPRLSEKAHAQTEQTRPVYTFVVAAEASKPLVRRAVKKQYGVTPRRVNVINRGGLKKAIVYLKPGDKINLA